MDELYSFVCVCVCVYETVTKTYAPSCLTLCDPMNYRPPAPLSMGFSKQEYWSG